MVPSAMTPTTRTALGERGEEAPHRGSTLATAERLCRSVGLMLVVLGALALLISFLAALRQNDFSALMLIFAGGGLLFGLLGGCCLLLAMKAPGLSVAPEASHWTRTQTRSSKYSLHEKGTQP